jgi:alginate O-acetyltransferase complex protein AlgI
MLFNSLEFLLLFMPLVYGGYHLSSKPLYRKLFLISASLFFYGWWDPRYLVLLIGSVLGNFLLASMFRKAENRFRLTLVIVGIGLNLGLLAYFKYAGFFVENVNDIFSWKYVVPNIVLPLAISFFTFQQLAFLVDSYRKPPGNINFVDYVLFVVFFPQLIAGPIVHHSEMLPQFQLPETFVTKFENIRLGFSIAALGLFKKVVVADGIGHYSDEVFGAAIQLPISFVEAWLGALAFGLQIYFDFSAYSDIAIGVALMFGIALPLNFNSPYKMASIIEFWRCWHMTLSRFLRQYLYIPLGGGKCGEWRRYFNVFVVMLLGGLWHGAGWNFIIWGGIHGVAIAINHGWRRLTGSSIANRTIAKICLWALTFAVVTAAWVPFRASDLPTTLAMYKSMLGLTFLEVQPGSDLAITMPGPLAFIAVAVGVVLFMPGTCALMSYTPPFTANIAGGVNVFQTMLVKWFAPGVVRLTFSVLALAVSIVFLLDEPSSFIYFQF